MQSFVNRVGKVGEMRSDMQSIVSQNRGKGIRRRNSVHREVLCTIHMQLRTVYKERIGKEWQTEQVTSMQVLGCVQSLVRRSKAKDA